MGKLHSLFISLLAFGLVACSQSEAFTGSGNLVTRQEEIADFSGITASNGFQVTVTPGADFRVEVRVDDNIEQFLIVRKDGDFLKLALDTFRPDNLRQVTLEADVAMPALQQVTLSGASSLVLAEPAEVETFLATLSGNSRLGGTVEASTVEIGLSGDSATDIGGQAEVLTVKAAGRSRADMATLIAREAAVDISGDSRATVNVNGRLDAEATGSSQLRYRGEPTLGDVITRGGASVAAE